jgi:LysM repeat protein
MYVGLPNPNLLMPLKKLHITKKDHSGDKGFDVLYNPEKYSQRREVQYSDKAGISTDMPITQFSHGTAEILEFSLFFDSMSAGGEVGGTVGDRLKFVGNSMKPSKLKKIDVRTYTNKVYKLMEIDPTLHVPPLLQLSWGSLNFVGHLMSCRQNFTRFSEDGVPVRAWLECTFRQFISNVGTKPLESPDTTKYRTVHQGDALWSLSAREYGEADQWREIARANHMENPRLLRSGDIIALPALK